VVGTFVVFEEIHAAGDDGLTAVEKAGVFDGRVNLLGKLLQQAWFSQQDEVHDELHADRRTLATLNLSTGDSLWLRTIPLTSSTIRSANSCSYSPTAHTTFLTN